MTASCRSRQHFECEIAWAMIVPKIDGWPHRQVSRTPSTLMSLFSWTLTWPEECFLECLVWLISARLRAVVVGASRKNTSVSFLDQFAVTL